MVFSLGIFLLQVYSNPRDERTSPWIIIMIIVIAGIILFHFLGTGGNKVMPTNHWSQLFDNYNHSSQAIYEAIEKAINDRNLPGVSTRKVNYSEGGVLSANREYLYIVRRRLVFAVCAAPFGKSFFVSWWHFEEPSSSQELLLRIPFIGKRLYKEATTKTFFQRDTDDMYKQEIQFGIEAIVNQFATDLGKRELHERSRLKAETVDAGYSF